jgi:hypothetical protein
MDVSHLYGKHSVLGQQTEDYYCNQLKLKTQGVEESLQKFTTPIKQLAHRAYTALPEDHIRRQAGKAFGYGVQDTAIKIHLLLIGEKTVNEALGQALEMQAVLPASKPHKTTPRTFWDSRSPACGRRDTR